jgi:putative ABC transport system substrate-binding protein
MDRRAFIAGIAGGLLAAPLAAEAQLPGKMPRIAFVSSNPTRNANTDAFDEGLRDLGYVVGQNVMVDYRFSDERIDRLRLLIEGVLRLGVDVIFASSPYVIRAARQATSTVPIVGIDLETDPIEAGWAKSLSNPGGNITGFFLDIPDLSGKLLQFLAEAVPRLRSVAVLWDARLAHAQFAAIEKAGKAANLKLQSLACRQAEEFDAALEAAHRQQIQSLVILSSPTVFVHLKHLAELAVQGHLPAISIFPEFAGLGGLIGYGPNIAHLFRDAAHYVDRILKGAKPTDLPIQRPSNFELVINLKTAKALSLTIPPSLLQRADQVIE